MKAALTAALLSTLPGISLQAKQPAPKLKPRLVVCTDIAPAEVESDDMESMVRLMVYADLFEIEALITSVGHNADPYPTAWKEYLTRVIEAYRKDVTKLMKRSGQKAFMPLSAENRKQKIGYWPSADYLTERAVMGSIEGGIKALGDANDSPGSNLLIRLADEDDARRFNFKEFSNLPSTVAWGIDADGSIMREAIEQLHLTSSSLPIFLICDSFNRVVFVQQGYTIGIGEQLLKVIHQL